MNVSVCEVTWESPREWWIEVVRVEALDRQGFLVLFGRNEGHWEVDFLWLGLLNARFT